MQGDAPERGPSKRQERRSVEAGLGVAKCILQFRVKGPEAEKHKDAVFPMGTRGLEVRGVGTSG